MAGARIAILDTEVARQRIVLGTSKYIDAIVGSTLRDCEIVLERSQSTIARTRFERCRFVARRPIGGAWLSGSFVDCSFHGRFRGARFGADPWSDPPFDGGLVRCDFSAARLATCELFGADVATLVLPPWPAIAVVDPTVHAEAWLAIPLPPELATLQRVLAEGPPRANVVVLDLEAEGVTDLDRVWSLVADVPFVLCGGRTDRPAVSAAQKTAAMASARAHRAAADRASADRVARAGPWITRASIVAVSQRDGGIDVDLKTAFLRKRVPDAPEQITIHLRGDVSWEPDPAPLALPFMLRACRVEDDVVVLRGGKGGASVRVHAASTTISATGAPLSIATLDGWERAYWRSDDRG